ncbi:MAG TPA: SCO family protein [Pyrinomonadaceae bacterium]|nr:SCO family protein [Pyrinomonadaceae bacterium]
MRHAYKFISAIFLRSAFALTLTFASVTLFASCAGKRLEERRYDLKGKVVSVDRVKGAVTVDHEDIAGFMPAMRMPFPLHDADVLKEVDGGDVIQATLVVTDESYRLENIFLTKGQPGAAAQATPTDGLAEPQPGAEIPDVKLLNQDGKPFTTRQLRGRALVVTFIYTRCPLPDQCPLMSANFAQLNAELAKDPDARKKTRLLSVTLDPEYDKPEVLRRYGAAYAGGNFDNWDFATGDPAEIRRLAQSFGLMYKAENDQVVHSLRTALVMPDGKLYKIYRGNEWKPADVLQDISALLTGWG